MNEHNVLVCFPFAGGNNNSFDVIKENLTKEVKVISVSYSNNESLYPLECSDFSFSKLLKNLKKQLLDIKTEGEITFFGHSMGAIVAYELAILCANQLNVHKLVVSACKPPELLIKSTLFNSKSVNDAIEIIANLGGLSKVDSSSPNILKQAKFKLIKDLQILSHYTRSIYPKINCEIHALSARDDSLVSKTDMKYWSNYTNKKFRENTFDGDHFYFRENPQEVAKVII
jgi:surfactin synthase thioesterase subunit